MKCNDVVNCQIWKKKRLNEHTNDLDYDSKICDELYNGIGSGTTIMIEDEMYKIEKSEKTFFALGIGWTETIELRRGMWFRKKIHKPLNMELQHNLGTLFNESLDIFEYENDRRNIGRIQSLEDGTRVSFRRNSEWFIFTKELGENYEVIHEMPTIAKQIHKTTYDGLLLVVHGALMN